MECMWGCLHFRKLVVDIKKNQHRWSSAMTEFCLWVSVNRRDRDYICGLWLLLALCDELVTYTISWPVSLPSRQPCSSAVQDSHHAPALLACICWHKPALLLNPARALPPVRVLPSVWRSNSFCDMLCKIWLHCQVHLIISHLKIAIAITDCGPFPSLGITGFLCSSWVESIISMTTGVTKQQEKQSPYN